MIPDIEGFLRPGYEKVHSHSWAGMFWFDLPLALIVIFVFHLVVREALIENLPPFLYKRFHFFKKINWNSYFLKHVPKVIFSILIGITTHLIWDRITHTDTYTYVDKAGINLPQDEKTELRIMLQYVSSLIGVAFMVWWIWRLPSTKEATPERVWKPYWLIVAGTVALVWRFLPRGPILDFVYDLANTGMTGLLLGLVLSSALFHLTVKRKRQA